MVSRKGKQKPRPHTGAGKAAGLLKEIARRRPDTTPDPDAAQASRDLLARALPYAGSAPLFFDTALKVGVVPDPPPVFTQDTTLLPTVKPQQRSLLGLTDEEEPC